MAYQVRSDYRYDTPRSHWTRCTPTDLSVSGPYTGTGKAVWTIPVHLVSGA